MAKLSDSPAPEPLSVACVTLSLTCLLSTRRHVGLEMEAPGNHTGDPTRTSFLPVSGPGVCAPCPSTEAQPGELTPTCLEDGFQAESANVRGLSLLSTMKWIRLSG